MCWYWRWSESNQHCCVGSRWYWVWFCLLAWCVPCQRHYYHTPKHKSNLIPCCISAWFKAFACAHQLLLDSVCQLSLFAWLRCTSPSLVCHVFWCYHLHTPQIWRFCWLPIWIQQNIFSGTYWGRWRYLSITSFAYATAGSSGGYSRQLCHEGGPLAPPKRFFFTT